MVFQPVVDLHTDQVVAHEALARGPADSALQRPDRLFGTARRLGRLAELDRLCEHEALRTALDAGACAPSTLLINVEPEAIGVPAPPETLALLTRAQPRTHVVLELTERALLLDPARLLAATRRARELGVGIALDDIGANRESLALVSVLAPDLVKLDLRLVQAHPSTEIAEIVTGVNAEVERAGISLVAEGIETEAHRSAAMAAGATLGQGWLFARPGPLDREVGTRDARPARRAELIDVDRTPFEIVSERRPVRRSTKPLLYAITRHLERHALTLGENGLLVGTFQHRRYLDATTSERYERFAQRLAFVGAVGVEVGRNPLAGVRGGDLTAGDRLAREWHVAVLGSHFAGALVALDLEDHVREPHRRFDFAVTYDRDLVVRVMQSLLARIAPRMPTGADLDGARSPSRSGADV